MVERFEPASWRTTMARLSSIAELDRARADGLLSRDWAGVGGGDARAEAEAVLAALLKLEGATGGEVVSAFAGGGGAWRRWLGRRRRRRWLGRRRRFSHVL